MTMEAIAAVSTTQTSLLEFRVTKNVCETLNPHIPPKMANTPTSQQRRDHRRGALRAMVNCSERDSSEPGFATGVVEFGGWYGFEFNRQEPENKEIGITSAICNRTCNPFLSFRLIDPNGLVPLVKESIELRAAWHAKAILPPRRRRRRGGRRVRSAHRVSLRDLFTHGTSPWGSFNKRFPPFG